MCHPSPFVATTTTSLSERKCPSVIMSSSPYDSLACILWEGGSGLFLRSQHLASLVQPPAGMGDSITEREEGGTGPETKG